jgi:transcription initiation factor IIF auxiliary subunit
MFPNHNKKNGCELDDHYVRLQIPIKPEHADMDDASPENIAQLERYGHELIEKSKDKIDFIVQVLNDKSQKKTFLPNKTHEDIKRTR